MDQAQQQTASTGPATERARRRRRALLGLVPVAAALAGTFFFHRYSILTGLDRVQGDPGDTRFVAFLLEHWNSALHGRADWRSPPIFYPVRGTLAYSEALVAMGALHAALRSTLGVFAAMNAQLILLSATSFAAAYALFARGFRLSVLGATVGAYFFAFSWPRFAQLVHVQLQFTTLLPLLLLLALECVRDGRALTQKQFAWRAGAFVTLLAVLLMTVLYYAVFVAILLSAAGAICLAHRPSRSHILAVGRRHAVALAAAVVLALLLMGPVIAFYLPLMRESNGRQWDEVLSLMPRPLDLLWMGRENWAWGWLFERWPEAAIVRKWPELRMGVGLAASLAWLGSVLWALLCAVVPARRARLDLRAGAVCVLVLTGLLLQFAMLRWPGDFSLWWVFWTFFPGAGGIRAVSRLQLLLALPMGLGFGWMLDLALRPRRRRPVLAGLALALVTAGALEQVGRVQTYSGRQAEALARRVGEAVPRACKAAYVVGTPDLVPHPPEPDAAHFDAAAYLAANPDVAASWRGTAWEHYVLFGRAEHRYLDRDAAHQERALTFFYNYTIPLAAILSGVPVVNGLSGWQPQGWHLFDVLAPEARQLLAEWLARRRLPADAVCVVPVRLQLEMLPDVPGGMFPDPAGGG